MSFNFKFSFFIKFFFLFLSTLSLNIYFYNPDYLNYLDIFNQCQNSFFKKHYQDRIFLCMYMNIFSLNNIKYEIFLIFNMFFFSIFTTLLTRHINQKLHFIILIPILLIFNYLFSSVLISNGLSIFLLLLGFVVYKGRFLSLPFSLVAFFNHYTSLLFIFSIFWQKIHKSWVLHASFFFLLLLILIDEYLVQYINHIFFFSPINQYRIYVYDLYIILTSIYFFFLYQNKELKKNDFFKLDFGLFALYTTIIIYFNYNFFLGENIFAQLFIRINHIYLAIAIYSFVVYYSSFIEVCDYKKYKYFNFLTTSSYLHLLFMIRAFNA